MYLCSGLDTSAATTILSALASRRGSQVVRSRSAKPLFAGSIPAPASRSRSVSLDNEAFLLRAGSIDSLASRRAHPSGFVYVARLPPAPFPPPPLSIRKSAKASSTILTVGCQRIRIQSIYKDVLQCP